MIEVKLTTGETSYCKTPVMLNGLIIGNIKFYKSEYICHNLLPGLKKVFLKRHSTLDEALDYFEYNVNYILRKYIQ